MDEAATLSLILTALFVLWAWLWVLIGWVLGYFRGYASALETRGKTANLPVADPGESEGEESKGDGEDDTTEADWWQKGERPYGDPV